MGEYNEGMRRALFALILLLSSLIISARSIYAQDLTFEECARSQSFINVTNNCDKHVVSVYECLTQGRAGRQIPLSEWDREKRDVVQTICDNLPGLPWLGTCQHCETSIYQVEIAGRLMTYKAAFEKAYDLPHSTPTPLPPGAPTPTAIPTPTLGAYYDNGTDPVERCFELIRRTYGNTRSPNCPAVFDSLSDCMNLDNPDDIYYLDPFWTAAYSANSNKFDFITEINKQFESRNIACYIDPREDTYDAFFEKLMDTYSYIKGEIMTDPKEYKTLHQESIADIAKQLSANCGTAGNACCDPDLQGILGSDPPDFAEVGSDRKVSFMQKWAMSLLPGIFGEYETALTTIADNRSLCNGTLNVKLKTAQGEIEAENEFELYSGAGTGEGNYIQNIQTDCGSLERDEDKIACVTNPTTQKKKIPKSEVESCTCSDPEAPLTSPLEGSVNQDFGLKPDDIRKQICDDQPMFRNACNDCYTNGGYFQGFLPQNENKCIADEQNAYDNLVNFLKPPSGDAQSFFDPSSSALAESDIQSTKDHNVLGRASVATCTGIRDVDNNLACRQCILSGRFWNRAGCTAGQLASAHLTSLCRAILEGSSERSACESCTSMGGIWTGIGCIYPILKTIIENQIFGIGLGFAGVVSILCIIFASFRMQISAGDPEKVKQAQELITSCITGLILVIFAVVILRVIGVDILRIPGIL